MLSIVIIYFNYFTDREGAIISSYLAIIISPIFTFLVAFLSEPLNLNRYIWGVDKYVFWFVVLIIITGYLTWFLLIIKILNISKKFLKDK